MRVFKKLVTISITTIGLSCAFTIAKPQKVSAAPWGARELFTTPKATRGTWYYKSGHKTRKCIITAHTADGRKLYKELPEKQYIKWERRLENHGSTKAFNYLDHNIWQAYTFRWHGITSFNTNSWLAGAGDGVYYVPVTKYHNSKKVKALRFGGGARNWLWFYAYKKVNKKTHHKIVKNHTKETKTTDNTASISQNNDVTTLSTKNFSISLNNKDVKFDPSKLKISFTFKNLSNKTMQNDDLQTDLNNCILVYQGNQYLNLTKSQRISNLNYDQSVKVQFESDQIKNDQDPIKVLFVNPRTRIHLKTVIIKI